MPVTSDKAMRAVFYLRVSTNEQSVEVQRDELRRVAEQRGWSLVAEYEDQAISGASTSRPGLDRMLEDARRGRFDVVAVVRLDRLGRSLQHLLQVLDELASLGVAFVSVNDAGLDGTTVHGRLMISIVGAFAAYERELIRERVIAGIRRAQARGQRCGRREVIVDVRPAVALLREGRGLRQVASILKISRSTLRRRLAEEGLWPPPVHNPTP